VKVRGVRGIDIFQTEVPAILDAVRFCQLGDFHVLGKFTPHHGRDKKQVYSRKRGGFDLKAMPI
jgi:hypothetical protein